MKGKQQLRIIGGRWRRRLIHFDAADGVRPTPDRIRETLFNWLTPVIAGARCLDLFAGTGALGIEALSRSAAEVVFVEQQSPVAHRLQHNLDHLLQSENASAIQTPYRVIYSDALRWLESVALVKSSAEFDIVFIDPPFKHNLLQPVCAALKQAGLLRRQAYVYLEMEADLMPVLPADWAVTHDKTAGQVRYCLAWIGKK